MVVVVVVAMVFLPINADGTRSGVPIFMRVIHDFESRRPRVLSLRLKPLSVSLSLSLQAPGEIRREHGIESRSFQRPVAPLVASFGLRTLRSPTLSPVLLFPLPYSRCSADGSRRGGERVPAFRGLLLFWRVLGGFKCNLDVYQCLRSPCWLSLFFAPAALPGFTFFLFDDVQC